MRRIFVALAVVSTFVVQIPAPLVACGDKLLMLGRGIRFQAPQHTPRAAVVLVYLPAATRSGGSLADPQFELALKEAGHTLRSVSSKEEMNEALRTGQYDVLLADLAEAPELQRTLTATGKSPFVLPAVHLVASASPQQIKADTARAAKDFSLVVQMPGRPGHYCAAVDKAMELKLKRESAKPTRR